MPDSTRVVSSANPGRHRLPLTAPTPTSRTPNLRAQLFAPIVVASLPLALFAAIVVFLLWQQQQSQLEQQQRATARAIAAAVQRELDASVRQLRYLAGSPALHPQLMQAFAGQAERALAVTPQWSNLVVFDDAARQVVNLRFPKPAAPNPEAQAYVRRALETREPVISDIFTGPSSKRLVVAVTVPAVRDGRALYAVSVTLNFASFDALLRERATDGAIVSLWDGRQRFISRSKSADEYRGKPPTPQFARASKGTPEGRVRTATMEGTDILSTWTPVPSTGWTVGLGSPSAQADALLRRYLWVLAAAELLILLTALYFTRAAAKRLQHEAAERQRAESERDRLFALEREARASAERASRSKDEFLAMLGHELRNPLAAMSNAVQLLEIEQARPEDAAFARGVIARQTRHLTRIIDDLLDVGRVITGKIELRRERFDVAVAVTNAVATLHGAGSDAKHELTVDVQSVTVDADRTRIEQVVINLVSNALAYTPAGGHVHVGVCRDGADAVITVRDDGSGIRADDLERVFDLFFQAKGGLERKGGLGLGLTLVRRLVELHRGTVSVASEGIGKGATFTVRLPATEAPPAPQPAQPDSAPAEARSILVIEDNRDARESLRKVLALQGHTVYEADDGKAGVAAATAMKPEIALVDIGLPQMDGYEVARALRAQHERGITLIALTGYGQPEDQQRALDAGFDAHLVKPADFDRLRVLIDSVPPKRRTGT